MTEGKNLLVLGVGGEGHRLAQRFLEKRPLTSIFCFDTKYGSNHYQNPIPEFLPRERFHYLDYSAVKTRDQLRRIPRTEEWFGVDKEYYYFDYMLTADDYGQGPNVVAKRFLARLGLIIDYHQLLDLLISYFAQVSSEQVHIVLACSLNGATGSGTFVDFGYLIRAAAVKSQKSVKITGLFLSQKKRCEEYAGQFAPDLIMNAHVAGQELEYFWNARIYEPDFLGSEFEPFREGPFDVVHIFDDAELSPSDPTTFQREDEGLHHNGKSVGSFEELFPSLSILNDFFESHSWLNRDEELRKLRIFPNRKIYE